MAAADAVPWTGKHRVIAWALFGIFIVGMVLFFVSYIGNSWYVVPVENNAYPPDNPVSPLNFGLFYMCFRGHCKYDLRQDYFVVNLLPPTLCKCCGLGCACCSPGSIEHRQVITACLYLSYHYHGKQASGNSY